MTVTKDPGDRLVPGVRVWSVFGKGKHPSAQRIALVVAASFAVAGAMWVLLTDVLLYEATRDDVFVARIETAKGWTFVVLATVLLYLVTYRCVRGLARAQLGVTAVIESIADGVLLLGPDRTIRRANPAAMQMLGAEDLVGLDADEFSRRFRVSLPDHSLVPPREFVSQRVFDEGGPLHYKAVLYPEHGPERVVSVTAAAVRVYAAEQPDMVVSVMHDITESERLSRLRDGFFAAAAHWLKTPVAIIKANAQILLTGGTAHANEAAVAIAAQCDRMDLLVQNLFVVGRIRSHSLQLYPRETDLLRLVRRVTAGVAAGSTERGVDTDLRVSSRVPVCIDQERVVLALRNLMEEAIQRSVQSEPVTVLLERRGRDARIGIRYFEHRPTGQAPPDSGGAYDELGMSRLVTRTIISAHGGDLQHVVDGAQETAWITLPVRESRG